MAIAKWIPLIFLQVVVIVGILFALKHFLMRNVSQVTTHLDRMGEDFSRKQEEAAQHLQKARLESQEIVTKAKQEAEKARQKATRQAESESEEILKKARIQSEQIVDEANRTKEFLLSEMDTKIREGAVDVAGGLLSRVLSDGVRRDDHSRRMAELLDGGLEGFRAANIPEGAEVRILSAYELSDEDRAAFTGKLNGILGSGIRIVVETDASLLAGVAVRVGDLVADGTLKYGIEEAVRDVRRSTT